MVMYNNNFLLYAKLEATSYSHRRELADIFTGNHEYLSQLVLGKR